MRTKLRKRRFILRKKTEMWLVAAGLLIIASGVISIGMWFAYPHLITLKSVPKTGIPDIVFEPPGGDSGDDSGGNSSP